MEIIRFDGRLMFDFDTTLRHGLADLQLAFMLHDDFCWNHPEFPRFPFAPDSRGQH